MELQKERSTTSLILKNRASLYIGGVLDIISSDENTVVLDTADGGLEISGDELRIKNMNVENGEISVEGSIDSLVFTDNEKKEKRSLFARMFK